ncbi:sugar nucleotide-binding protein [Burkholderia semiarida]|uniref:Sugar nucleotide-binding protein n=1 Tax=Burkholderia semiarida TaxID=2843303 RepID=A0ABW7L607_9BURK
MAESEERVLITGAGGVIGHALRQELADSGYSNVVAITSSDVDLRDQNATEAMFNELRPTIVFHMAARVYGIIFGQRSDQHQRSRGCASDRL